MDLLQPYVSQVATYDLSAILRYAVEAHQCNLQWILVPILKILRTSTTYLIVCNRSRLYMT